MDRELYLPSVASRQKCKKCTLVDIYYPSSTYYWATDIVILIIVMAASWLWQRRTIVPFPKSKFPFFSPSFVSIKTDDETDDWDWWCRTYKSISDKNSLPFSQSTIGLLFGVGGFVFVNLGHQASSSRGWEIINILDQIQP